MSFSKDSYRFRHAAHHTAKAGTREDWRWFFRAVESHQHLDRQAGHFGNFEQTSEDLETYCLPAIVKLQDWHRFVHYALIAANLRGLAEALAGEDVLELLTRHGRLLRQELTETLEKEYALEPLGLGKDYPGFDRPASDATGLITGDQNVRAAGD